jgi:hypothetical protein
MIRDRLLATGGDRSALETLRAATADPAKCKQTITELLSRIDSVGKS